MRRGAALRRAVSGAFTVYRPSHWIYDNTDLHYGDIFGAEAGIFGYELDGLDYTFRRGLPYPTGSDGAPPSVEILGMAPAMNAETEHAGEGFRYYLRDHDLRGVASTMLGSTSPESLDERRYGFRHDRPYDEGKGRGRDRGNLRVDHGPQAQRLLHAADHAEHTRQVFGGVRRQSPIRHCFVAPAMTVER